MALKTFKDKTSDHNRLRWILSMMEAASVNTSVDDLLKSQGVETRLNANKRISNFSRDEYKKERDNLLLVRL